MALEFVKNNIGETWLTTTELACLTKVDERTIRRTIKKYVFRQTKHKGGFKYQILLSSIEPEIQAKYYNSHSLATQPAGAQSVPAFSLIRADREIKDKEIIPEKAKQIALKRLDLIQAWEEYRLQPKNNKEVDKEFIKIYNNGLLHKNIFEYLGKVSIATLYRWKKDYKSVGNYRALLPGYKYQSAFVKTTKLNEVERKWLLDLLLSPSEIPIGTAVRLINFTLSQKGVSEICSYATFKRFADWYKKTHKDVWVLMRKGQKAVKDLIEPYIIRDPQKLKVGDVLVADGHTMDFEVLNPFTKKPCRATLIIYLDWASMDVAGYEIMLSENTQCIASALRHAIIRLGKTPKIAYQDNGRAFRGKYFTDNNLEECGFNGLFGNLKIIPVFALAYNARAKVVERFNLEFSRSCEKLLPSYVGNSPTNKPAYKNRNEKFHKEIHSNFIPTIEEAKLYIEKWLEFYRAQPCPHHKNKTIGQVFYEGVGAGVAIDELDDLMLAQEIRKIRRSSITFLGNIYYSDDLYGLDETVLIKYSLFDLSKIRVYTKRGEYICEATTSLKIHPMAAYLGEQKDVESLKSALKNQKSLREKTMRKAVEQKKKSQNLVAWQNDLKLIAATENLKKEEGYEFVSDFIPNYEEPTEKYEFRLEE